MVDKLSRDLNEYLQCTYDLFEKDISNVKKQWIEIAGQQLEELKTQLQKDRKKLNRFQTESQDVIQARLMTQENEEAIFELEKKEKSQREQLSEMKELADHCLMEKQLQEEAFEQEKMSYDALDHLVEAKQSLISTNIKLFKEHLGLEIRTLKGNRMQFVFKNLDPSSPDSIGSIIIRLEDRIYSVTESMPPLDNLSELEKTLNATNNLAGFVQSSRAMLKTSLNVQK